ncbi:hypothetical protein TNCT_175911 [Trichonephila clavata]|uniref:Uncharacterized protein n=1 Tax=Trichonephila clavata TaxID=2740835 RepID=A0A8X6LWA3_TRICU|nr:hypothetical protein TNCT_175911 [Trichonephila clavata]
MHVGWFYRDPYARYMQRGSVTFVPTRHGIHRAMKGFRTEPWTHRFCVLIHVVCSYRHPSTRYMRRRSVTFFQTRHDIHRAVEGFRTELWTTNPAF